MQTELDPVDRLEHAVQGVWQVVVSIESDVVTLVEGQERLERKLDVTATALSDKIDSTATDLKTRITAVDTKLDAAVGDLSDKITAVDTRVAALDEKLDAIGRAVGVGE